MTSGSMDTTQRGSAPGVILALVARQRSRALGLRQ
jgi:hypothetical protein